MDSCEKFNNIYNKCYLTTTLSTENVTLQKIRTIPNILNRQRSKKMENSRMIAPTPTTDKCFNRKKQIFDPVRSELLTWENFNIYEPIKSEENIDCTNFHEYSNDEVESDISEYSPMWCPTSIEHDLTKQTIEIVETVTINLPISEITDSLCSEFVEPEFYEFQNEMNIPIFDSQNSDVEMIIELSRFEYNKDDDKLEILKQEDPFDKIVTRTSWKKFECLSCGKIYKSQFNLNCHLKQKHHRLYKISSLPVIVFTCPGCFKIFKTCSGYDRHGIRCNIINRPREE